MTLRVQIEDTTVITRNFAATETRASFQAKSQTGILKAGKYTYPLNIRLNQDQAPYPVGEYLVDDESFGVDEYDNVSIRRGGLKMRSVAEAAARVKAAAAS